MNETKKEWEYKEVVKDEESLIKYLKDLAIREDIGIENKIFSACMAGRLFEFEKYLHGHKEMILDIFRESWKQANK